MGHLWNDVPLIKSSDRRLGNSVPGTDCHIELIQLAAPLSFEARQRWLIRRFPALTPLRRLLKYPAM